MVTCVEPDEDEYARSLPYSALTVNVPAGRFVVVHVAVSPSGPLDSGTSLQPAIGDPPTTKKLTVPAPAAGEPEVVSRLREGLEGIERNFLNILERHGIRSEDPTGAPFDPNLHQAMAEQESAAHAPGTVMHAWTPAWTLHGRLLRPAMVVVAKAPPGDITSAAKGAKLDTTA